MNKKCTSKCSTIPISYTTKENTLNITQIFKVFCTTLQGHFSLVKCTVEVFCKVYTLNRMIGALCAFLYFVFIIFYKNRRSKYQFNFPAWIIVQVYSRLSVLRWKYKIIVHAMSYYLHLIFLFWNSMHAISTFCFQMITCTKLTHLSI